MDQLKAFFEKNRTAFFILGGILLLAMPAILNTPYLLRIGIMIGIYIVPASSLNLIIGFTGQFQYFPFLNNQG